MPSSKIKNDYFNASKPVHHLSYCAFLDVLGFSQRLRDSYKKKEGDKLLQEFHAIFEKRITALKADTDETLLYFKSFTDNVVLAHPQFSDDMESEFAFILWSILEYQFDMALAGFFVRGGLAVGKLFVDDNSVYGEALLDSYELESKVAVNPIVVLSDDAMKLVNHHVSYYGGMDAPQRTHVLVGPDGRYFLNYLSECLVETSEGDHLDKKSLRKHKLRVEAALKENASTPAVFAKFTWLAAYHNYFCDTVAGYPEYSPSLKIPAKLAAINFSRIKK
jgi:hypothetical protein